MPIRLLALDVDGTLVNSHNEVTAATIDALRRLRAAGVRIVLATGRRYSRTISLVEPLGLDTPLVTASGALIKRPSDHQTLFAAHFARTDLCQLLAVVERHGAETLLYGDTFAEGFDFYLRGHDVRQPELAEYLAVNPNCERLWPEMVSAPPEGIFAGFSMGSRAEMMQLDQALTEELPGRLYTHVIRSPRYRGYMCEIAPAGATKWSGVCRLADEWGIAGDEICAVGDDVNDLPMIRGAGLGVAMANAVPELQAEADRIAPHNDADGLVEVVDWVLASWD